MNSCNQIGVQDVSELPVDTFQSTPDFVLGIRVVLDEQTGNMLNMFTRIPGNRIMPNGNNDNIFTLETNNPALTVAEGQVLPCYIQNTVTQTRVLPADGTHPADFLVLKVEAGIAFCQSVSASVIPEGHDYDVYGAQYYLGTNGEPTTDATQTGQKLFKSMNKYQILINM